MAVYPGTTVNKTELSGKQFLNGIFIGTNGLVMQQIKELTDLNTPAIQNWVSRGFVPHPVNKRYSKDATARIFIINVLRETMTLEDIKKLLIYVNGNPESREDDIIPESKLYSYFCDIVFNESFSFKNITQLVKQAVAGYKERVQNAKERLEKTLEIICTNYLASNLLTTSKTLLSSLENSNILGEQIK